MSLVEYEKKRIARHGSERGQALVEFALIVPALLILLFGIVDFGLAYSSNVRLTNAVREGARCAIVNPNNNTTCSVNGSAGSIIDVTNYEFCGTASSCANLTVSSPSCSPSCSSGNSITVSATYTYTLQTPLAAIMKLATGGTVSTSITISASSTMRIE